MNSRLKITKERKEQMILELKSFFLSERGEEIGDLAAVLMLDFILGNIAPVFYNQGIEDCITYLKDKMDDLYGLEI